VHRSIVACTARRWPSSQHPGGYLFGAPLP
jgi:hypothetical protein